MRSQDAPDLAVSMQRRSRIEGDKHGRAQCVIKIEMFDVGVSRNRSCGHFARHTRGMSERSKSGAERPAQCRRPPRSHDPYSLILIQPNAMWIRLSKPCRMTPAFSTSLAAKSGTSLIAEVEDVTRSFATWSPRLMGGFSGPL